MGKLGSGKSISAIREIANDKSGRMNYSNIKNDLKNCKMIRGSDIIKKILVSTKEKKDGSVEEKFKYEFNMAYWLKQKKPLNIIWDEIHFVANSRSSQSSLNKCMGKFLSSGRRIVGMDEGGYGHFIFLAQASRTIDVNIRDLCNEVRYHIMWWISECKMCGKGRWVTSEVKEVEFCIFCGSWKLLRRNFMVQVYKFYDFIDYQKWNEGWGKFYFEKVWITDVEDYFEHYNTHQIEGIFDEFT